MNMNSNFIQNSATDQDFIPLEITNNSINKNDNGVTNLGNLHYRRKRENKASTYGLNSSENTRHLRDDGSLTPWRSKEDNLYAAYPGVIGFVFD